MILNRTKMFFILFLFILNFSQVKAEKYNGFSQISNQELLTMNEAIERFIENKSEFLILFTGHPAFYSFPKNRNQAPKFKAFLESKISSGKTLKIIFDPKNTQIISIENSLDLEK